MRVAMADLGVREGQRALLVWAPQSSPEALRELAEEVGRAVGAGGHLAVENVERLELSSHPSSSFDLVLSCLLPDAFSVHTTQTLAEMLRVMRPGGRLVLDEAVTGAEAQSLRTAEKVVSALKLSGFTAVTQVSQEALTPEALSCLRTTTGYQGNTLSRLRLSASKPEFEVGSSRKINLRGRPAQKQAPPPDAVRMWTLSANDMGDDDVELLDSDALLDEDDLKKPDQASLRAPGCGEGAKKAKKACKNCSCGLAEELAAENSNTQKKQLPKSSCGSCYLGDAFRCASCPYAGMPAFKPGEKILLDTKTLTDA